VAEYPLLADRTHFERGYLKGKLNMNMTSGIALNHNIAVIAKELLSYGDVFIKCEYEGGGDSGDIYHTSVMINDGNEIEVELDKKMQEKTLDGWNDKAIYRNISLDEAIADATWLAVSVAGHSGWENGEGGRGAFYVWSHGSAELEHCNSEEVTEDHENSALEDYGSLIQQASRYSILAKIAGLIALEINYTCWGGEDVGLGAIKPINNPAASNKHDEETICDMLAANVPELSENLIKLVKEAINAAGFDVDIDDSDVQSYSGSLLITAGEKARLNLSHSETTVGDGNFIETGFQGCLFIENDVLAEAA
jgi:hypothetical protein